MDQKTLLDQSMKPLDTQQENQSNNNDDQLVTDGGNESSLDLRWNWKKDQKTPFDEKHMIYNANDKQQPQPTQLSQGKEIEKKEEKAPDSKPTEKEEKKHIIYENDKNFRMPDNISESESVMEYSNIYKNCAKQQAMTEIGQSSLQKSITLNDQTLEKEMKQPALTQKQGQNKTYTNQQQNIHNFSKNGKSSTIEISQCLKYSVQGSSYYENYKLGLTEDITSYHADAKFQIENIKYCVGFGVCLKEVIEKHNYCYKSDNNEMSHGLYIVTSQGYSWSHSEKEDDDAKRESFDLMYAGAIVDVGLHGEQLSFKWKKGQFTMLLPARLREKYTLTFCVYLHDKGDAVILK